MMTIRKVVLTVLIFAVAPVASARYIDLPKSIEQVLPDGIEVASYVDVWNEMEEARCARLSANGRNLGAAWGFEAQGDILIVYPCEFYSGGEMLDELKAAGHIAAEVESGGRSSIAHRFSYQANGEVLFEPLGWPGQSMLSYERVCDRYVAYYQVFGSKVWGAMVEWNSENILEREFLGNGTLGTDSPGALGEPLWSIDCSAVIFPASMPGLSMQKVLRPATGGAGEVRVGCQSDALDVSRKHKSLRFHLIRCIDDAALDRFAINRYGADQTLWGDHAEAQALYEPVSGKNHLLYFLAEYESPRIHDDPAVLETRRIQLLLEVNSAGRIVAGLHSPVVFDEVPHAVSFHYFFDGNSDLSAQLEVGSLPWTGFVSDVFLFEPKGVIDTGRVD